MYPKYLYHAVEAPIVVHSLEEHERMGDEWKESPMEGEGFLERDEVITTIDTLCGDAPMTEEMKLQAAGEFFGTITDYMDGLIQLEKMKKAELVEFAYKHLGLELKSSMRKAHMIEAIREEAEPEQDVESIETH